MFRVEVTQLKAHRKQMLSVSMVQVEAAQVTSNLFGV